MKKNNGTLNKIKIIGNAHINFINNCISKGIVLENIERTSTKEMFCFINDKDYKKISKLDNRNYQIELVQVGGRKKFLNKFIYRIGFVIGLIISMIGLMVIDNRLLQIHIQGLISINETLVVDKLTSLGVTKFSNMNYDFDLLENKLIEEFDFSLVSIVTKGNSIIINVKESLPSIEDSYIPITADYNMVIKSIEVFSGTSLIKEGDIVYKGDVLVEPYIKSGESVVYVTPCANIVAEVYFSNSYVFYNQYEEYVRTGKKEIISYDLKLGIFTINKKSQSTTYVTYETENIVCNISNYFLPIKIEKTYCYETEKKTTTRDFETEKDKIINSQKELLYSTISQDIKFESENVNVVPIENGYIINIYINSILEFRY